MLSEEEQKAIAIAMTMETSDKPQDSGDLYPCTWIYFAAAYSNGLT